MEKKSSTSVRVFYPRFDRKTLKETISRRLPSLMNRLPISSIILFGSVARGTHTVRSDIDILIVYEGARREDAYTVVKKVLDIPRLEPHVYTEEEYIQVKERVDKMVRNGISIFYSRTWEPSWLH